MIRHDIHRLLLLGGIALAAAQIVAQTPASSGPLMSFTATTDGVAGAPDSIRIDVLRWSTDAERDQLMSAWNMTGSGRGARGGAGFPSIERLLLMDFAHAFTRPCVGGSST